MFWEEVEEKYGKKMAAKMKKSKYLYGNTMSVTEDGRLDIPERDIDLAYREVTGKPIYLYELD